MTLELDSRRSDPSCVCLIVGTSPEEKCRLAEILQPLPWICLQAESVEEACQVLESRGVSVVIVVLSEEQPARHTWRAILGTISASAHPARLVVTTGDGQLWAEALETGADQSLRQPCQGPDVLYAMSQARCAWLDAGKQERHLREAARKPAEDREVASRLFS